MQYAIVENGVVVNVVMADAQTATENGWIKADGASTGDLYDGEVFVAPQRDVTPADVNAEAMRRLEESFVFNGVAFDFDPKSQARITGAATLAGFAMGAGAQAGDYFWANPNEGFAWIAQDNSVVPMDAQTCFAFGQAAAGHESAHVFAAYALKAISTPDDYTDDKWWP